MSDKLWDYMLMNPERKAKKKEKPHRLIAWLTLKSVSLDWKSILYTSCLKNPGAV